MTFFSLKREPAARGASRVITLQSGRSDGGEADLSGHDKRPQAGRRGERNQEKS